MKRAFQADERSEVLRAPEELALPGLWVRPPPSRRRQRGGSREAAWGVFHFSRAIVRTKADYDRLLQEVRDHGHWEAWVLYMLGAVERTAIDAIATIQGIKALLLDYKHRIRAAHRFYSQDLINNLFSHPYTKIEFVQHDLQVSRLTATRYLDLLADTGFVRKYKAGRHNYYINEPLFRILTGEAAPQA